MKRSELNVGDELYYAKPGDWHRDYDGKKVVVLSVEPYRDRLGQDRGRGDRFLKVDKGTGVLVEIHSKTTGRYRRVVQLAQLHGPYETVAAEVRARAEQRHARDVAIMADRVAFRSAADAVAWRAHEAGFKPCQVLRGGELIALEPSVLTALLDAANVPQ